MASFTLTNNNDIYNAPIGLNNYVDAAGGVGDVLTMDWSSLTAPQMIFQLPLVLQILKSSNLREVQMQMI